MFRLKLFGGLSLEGPDGPVGGRATQRHRLALLALLATIGRRGLLRERLVAYLWPDYAPDKGRRLLSDSIYRINRTLGSEAVASTGDALHLDDAVVASDVAAFRLAVQDGRWEAAVELYTGSFLDGFHLPGAPEFEHWVEEQRRQLARAGTDALQRLAEGASSDPAAAVAWWLRLAEADPYSARIARRVMEALVERGDRAAAIRHAREHVGRVERDLEIAPDPGLLRFAEEIAEAPVPRPLAAEDRAGSAVKAPSRPPQRTKEASQKTPSTAPSRRAAALRGSWVSGRLHGSARVVGALAVASALALAAAFGFSRGGGDAAPPESLAPSSMAVLPFDDLSPGGGQQYLGDGIAEELIGRLSDTEGIRVVGRTSSFSFRHRATDLREIGQALDVGSIVEGSVRQAGERLRISVRLVDTNTGFDLWQETFERTPHDIFAIQDDIARAIVSRLRGSDGPIPVPSTVVDPVAYNLYLAGRYEWHKRSEDGLRAAAGKFQEAVERSPTYARAHAGLGDALAVLAFYDYLPPREAFPAAAEAARRAIELDSTLAEPHATLGYVALYYDWDAQRSEEEFLKALSLEPSYSIGHQWYANLLTASGRFDEAVREMGAARELDPLSLIASAALGFVYMYAGQHERAVEQLEGTLELAPEFELAHLWLGMSLEGLGRTAESLAALRRAEELSGSAISRAALARGLFLAGFGAEAGQLLDALERRSETGYAPSFEIAKIHAARGDRGQVTRWLRRAYEERSHSLAFLAVDPQLEGWREDPDFQALLQRVPVALDASRRLR